MALAVEVTIQHKVGWWRAIDFLKHESEALAVTKQYAKSVSGLFHGKRIKTLQTDEGGDFISEECKAWCKDQVHIHLITSGAYAHQQNGIAERESRTVPDAARATRAQAGSLGRCHEHGRVFDQPGAT